MKKARWRSLRRGASATVEDDCMVWLSVSANWVLLARVNDGSCNASTRGCERGCGVCGVYRLGMGGRRGWEGGEDVRKVAEVRVGGEDDVGLGFEEEERVNGSVGICREEEG
ncbi:hypothetical protein V8G54_007835 [Vigna mungo]|uniref:Uncharacterized protein n=1 Tax=Vigna mungo TaxID=3915 RepID=A0AAQ3P655_VIGMU